MDDKDSIVLFKSTFRPEYKRLLLTSLGVPTGAYYWTYYKKEHSSPDLVREAETSPSTFEGKKATLIFFDRNPEADLRFYPLRDFTIWETEANGTIDFQLCPREYYDYTEHELKEFNQLISEEMALLPPVESSWAQFFSLRCLDRLNTSSDQRCWERLVDYLDLENIGDNDFKDSVFYRLGIPFEIETKTNTPYSKENGYILNSNKRYEWDGFFYKPRETKESFEIKLDVNEDIVPITDRIKILPGRNRPFKFEFRCKRISNDKNLKIRIVTPEKDPTGTAPRLEMPAKINKLPVIEKIGWEGPVAFIGFLIASAAQTYGQIPENKFILSAIGNFLSIFGIAMWKKKD